MSGEKSDVVSVRFPAELIQAVKHIADEDGVTTSAWIRGVIDKRLRPPEESPTPSRREAIDQAYRRWPSMDQEERVKFAKAYLMDTVQAQCPTASGLSDRVTSGIALLREALRGDAVCPQCNRPKLAS